MNYPAFLKAGKAYQHEINQLRRTTGNVWQKESYDHIVRNAEALERIRKYILNHKA